MKPWIRRTLLGLFGASVALGGLTACGYHRDHHGWNAGPEEQARWQGRMVDRVARKLDLDEAQKAKLTVVAQKVQEQRKALRGAGDPRADVQQLVAGEKFDRAKAQALIGEKTAAVTAKSPEVVTALGDFYDSLRPEQQAKVRDYMQRHQRGWWHRG